MLNCTGSTSLSASRFSRTLRKIRRQFPTIDCGVCVINASIVPSISNARVWGPTHNRDSSSFAVRALDAWRLSYLAPLSAVVTVCPLHSARADLDGLEIMLNGGQMGDADLFGQLIHGNSKDPHLAL